METPFFPHSPLPLPVRFLRPPLIRMHRKTFWIKLGGFPDFEWLLMKRKEQEVSHACLLPVSFVSKESFNVYAAAAVSLCVQQVSVNLIFHLFVCLFIDNENMMISAPEREHRSKKTISRAQCRISSLMNHEHFN